MAKSRYKFFDDVWNDNLNHSQKGLMTTNIGDLFKGADDILFTIPREDEFRPDIISSRFYGDPKLYWVLVYANNISDSPEGFYEGRVIRVPRYERVIELV